MKSFNFITVANESIKNVSKELRNANREYTSLSSVLKDIQRVKFMEAGYATVFEGLGLRSDGKFTPREFTEVMCEEQFAEVTVGKGKDKHTEKRLGVWGYRQKVDPETKEKVYEQDGVTPVMEAVLRVVTSWTPTKLFKAIAQANAIKAQAK